MLHTQHLLVVESTDVEFLAHLVKATVPVVPPPPHFKVISKDLDGEPIEDIFVDLLLEEEKKDEEEEEGEAEQGVDAGVPANEPSVLDSLLKELGDPSSP